MDVIIPFEVVTPRRLHVLAVWSYNNRHRKSEMDKLRGPVLCAIDFLADWLRSAPSLIVGDFNNHPVWDKSTSGKNLFSEHLKTFESLGMRSIYHQWLQEEHGKETRHTHFWTGRNYYHIDYIFASESLRKSAQFDIMSFEAMRELGIKSDHVPLWMDLSVPGGEIS